MFLIIAGYSYHHKLWLGFYKKPEEFGQKTDTKPKLSNQAIEELVDAVYGKNGVNLSLDNVFKIQDLIKSIGQLSEKEEQLVASAAVQILYERGSQVSFTQETFDLYTIIHLQKIAGTTTDTKQFSEKIITIAQDIVWYATLEQNNIFDCNKTKYIFFSAQKGFRLPRLINFWVDEQGQKLINNYDPSQTVKTQNMLLEMAIMIAVDMSISLANNQLSLKAAKISEKIMKDSQAIQASLQAFQNKSQEYQQQNLQSIMTVFSDGEKEVVLKTKNAYKISNMQLDYLYKNISMNQPQQQYVSSQVQLDQLFSLGTMLTPDGALWKNPLSVGDWEYEKENNSFWQYQKSPMFTDIQDSSGVKTVSSAQAENNSIFTEYFTTAKSYTISGSITIYQKEYPFFTGIIFNKARWISGDYESLRKCRMIGIYGKSDSDIGVYFAQQNSTKMDSNENPGPIKTAYEQIIDETVNKKIEMPSDNFKDIDLVPTVFNFEITTSPSKVSFNFYHGEKKGTPVVIENIDPSIFLYHGIGFTCPGAIAQFRLKEPKDLIFSDQDISNYKD